MMLTEEQLRKSLLSSGLSIKEDHPQFNHSSNFNETMQENLRSHRRQIAEADD